MTSVSFEAVEGSLPSEGRCRLLTSCIGDAVCDGWYGATADEVAVLRLESIVARVAARGDGLTLHNETNARARGRAGGTAAVEVVAAVGSLGLAPRGATRFMMATPIEDVDPELGGPRVEDKIGGSPFFPQITARLELRLEQIASRGGRLVLQAGLSPGVRPPDSWALDTSMLWVFVCRDGTWDWIVQL